MQLVLFFDPAERVIECHAVRGHRTLDFMAQRKAYLEQQRAEVIRTRESDGADLSADEQLGLALLLVERAVAAKLGAESNTYVTSATEDWLTIATALGVYDGPLTGNRVDLLRIWAEKAGG